MLGFAAPRRGEAALVPPLNHWCNKTIATLIPAFALV
jgi:hypothetical protein